MKSLLYGINNTRRERYFNARFGLGQVVACKNKEILGCLNRMRKKKLVGEYQGKKEEVVEMISRERI